jgi:hypothetical protein
MAFAKGPPGPKDMEQLSKVIAYKYRVRNALLTMTKDRGYDTDTHVVPLDQYMAQYPVFLHGETSGLLLMPSAKPSKFNRLAKEPIMIFLNDATTKLGKEDVKGPIERALASKVSRAIMVCACEPTPKAVEELTKQGPTLWFELFLHSTILANPMESEMYYRSFKCITDDTDFARLELEFGSLVNFPCILRSDPVARHLGMRLGEVIEVTYKSESAGVYKEYRVCRQVQGADKQFDSKDAGKRKQ